MEIVIVEKWSIRPEKMPQIHDLFNDLRKWREFDESLGARFLGIFKTLVGDEPFSSFMAIFTMPDMAAWEKVYKEIPKRMAEEEKRWNEMVTNYSITIMQKVL